MKSERGVFFALGVFFITVIMIFSGFLTNAGAAPRGRGAVEGPRSNVGAEGARSNIAVGTRYNVLPATAKPILVSDRTYYLDSSGVYYLPCEDDDTVFCVVAAPE